MLQNEARTHKDKLMQAHRVRKALDTIQQRTQQLVGGAWGMGGSGAGCEQPRMDGPFWPGGCALYLKGHWEGRLAAKGSPHMWCLGSQPTASEGTQIRPQHSTTTRLSL